EFLFDVPQGVSVVLLGAAVEVALDGARPPISVDGAASGGAAARTVTHGQAHQRIVPGVGVEQQNFCAGDTEGEEDVAAEAAAFFQFPPLPADLLPASVRPEQRAVRPPEDLVGTLAEMPVAG